MAAEPAREGLYSPERDIARVAGPSLCSAQWASYGDWSAAKAASSEGSGEADTGAEAAQQLTASPGAEEADAGAASASTGATITSA